jgi:hypothetical protein
VYLVSVLLEHKKLIAGLLVVILASFSVPLAFLSFSTNTGIYPDGFYMGIIETGNISETKGLIDATKAVVNLIVISNMTTIKNLTMLEEVADNAYREGLNFFVRMTYPTPFEKFSYNPFEWEQTAKVKYGEQFLGYYLYDEPGGNQLDLGGFRQFDNTTLPYDYRDAANTFVYYLYIQMRDFIKTDHLVTSDYGLYWFDYEAGYDSVFTEFGWNHSRPLSIALCRGAAEMHNRTWGVTVTWTYTDPPHLESGPELYNDLIAAYQAGANYITIFNEPRISEYGLLSEEHLSTIKQFKEFVNKNPQNRTSNVQKIAYVLPANYGWGLRSLDDKIWGVWPADNDSQTIWNDIEALIDSHNYNFDIIYDSPWTRLFGKAHYDNLIWWNGTKIP